MVLTRGCNINDTKNVKAMHMFIPYSLYVLKLLLVFKHVATRYIFVMVHEATIEKYL